MTGVQTCALPISRFVDGAWTEGGVAPFSRAGDESPFLAEGEEAEGAEIEQTLYETGCGIEAEAVGNGEMQRRSYPNSGARHQNTGGWEFVLQQDLIGHAPRIAEEAVALLSAKPCPSDIRTTVILSGNQVALQVHESCGHAIELDRVLGSEAAFAGTSFPLKVSTRRETAARRDSSTPVRISVWSWIAATASGISSIPTTDRTQIERLLLAALERTVAAARGEPLDLDGILSAHLQFDGVLPASGDQLTLLGARSPRVDRLAWSTAAIAIRYGAEIGRAHV